MIDNPTRMLGTAAFAMVASAGAAIEKVPLGYFATAITVVTLASKLAGVCWKAWRGAEEWLDRRMEKAFQRSIEKLRLPCIETNGTLCDTGSDRRRRTPIPLHPPLEE